MQTNGMKPFYKEESKGFIQKFKEKWKEYEVVEIETNRYTFRLRLAILCLVGFFVIFVFLLFFDPSLNKYPNVSITLMSIAFALVIISILVSSKAIETVSKIYPYDPAKTQAWREKKDEKTLDNNIKELYKE